MIHMNAEHPNDNEIECARCGESFYFELTECPHCGVNIYFPDDEFGERYEMADRERGSGLSDWLQLPLAILVGWIVSALISVVIYMLIKRVFQSPGEAVNPWIIFTITSLGALAGGFSAHRIADQKPLLYGTLTGLLSTAAALLFLLNEWGSEAILPLSLETLVGAFSIILAAVIGAWASERMLREREYKRLFSAPAQDEELYRQLLSHVMYDENVAERLIEYERKQVPSADRTTLIRNAIARWERDNRIIP